MKYRFNNPILKPHRQQLRNNMTEAEILLWDKIKNGQVLGYKFRRQYSVGIFILDFYCSKLKLAIEVDGGQHAEEKTAEYDQCRTNYLNNHNITVLRYWNHEIFDNMEGIYSDIKNNIENLIKIINR